MHMFEQTFSKFHNTFEQTYFIQRYREYLSFRINLNWFKLKPTSRFAAPLVKREMERLQKLRDIRLEYDNGEIVIFYLAN